MFRSGNVLQRSRSRFDLTVGGRTFRVFVSSTFSDLKVERNALARWVFPRLRALCEARGYKFQAVDLRWGVREEAALDQQTVRICLEEVARCRRLSPRPNFIALLGDRYGWCPPPSMIPAGELEALRPLLSGANTALVDKWYQRDDNAVPTEYVLQPRRGAFEEYATWKPVERQLREALVGAAERARLAESAKRNYRASATELEIIRGALDVPDAREHVFAFLRSIENLDDVKAALPADLARELVDTAHDTTWDADAWNAQGRLKTSLADRLGSANVWTYEVRWTNGALDLSGVVSQLPANAAPPEADARLPDTHSLCEAVWHRLSRVIAKEMDALDRESHDPLAVEQRAHAEFAEERRRVFVGRQEPLGRIAEYLKRGPARPLVVHGPSGSGKSALMARAIADARIAHPQAVIVDRFIGAALGASEARSLLESLSRELTRSFGGDETSIPITYEKLVNAFPDRLALAQPQRPVIVLLDALDQLSETHEGRRLVWLPRELPPNVRIVVSTLPDEKYQCFPELRATAQPEDLVPISPMSPAEGEKILDAWLSVSARAVTVLQRDALLRRFRETGLPLYFKLAFEEARRWHSYDGDAPAAALPGNTAGMIKALYRRLSDDSQHGATVVGRVLAYLAAGRHGLSDQEILHLLWRDTDVREDFERRKRHEVPEENPGLPPVIWSRLYFDLEPYLGRRDDFGVHLLTLNHRQLSEVALTEDLHSSAADIHRRLADYFATWA